MGLLGFYLRLVVLAIIVSAAPLNVTTTTYEGMYGTMTIGQEPRGRGTFGIAISSSATFIFCVWTAVHPNVVTGASSSDRMKYRSFLMLLSIVVPEGIAVCAFGQWREAKVVLKAWRLKMNIPDSSWIETLKFWKNEDDGLGLGGAFFVVMGGFVVDLEDPATSITPGNQSNIQWTTLTSNGFLKYLHEGYIHDQTFDKASIVDKGKSSVVAKAVASAQAIWFIAQCVTRWSVGLPLTLLEIHVGIQVFCTAVLYMCWWSKPLDVDTPINIVLRTKAQYQTSGHTEPPMTPHYSPEDLEREIGKTDEQLLDRRALTRSFVTRPPPRGFLAQVTKASYDVVIYVTERPIGPRKKDHTSPNKAVIFEGILVVASGMLHAAAWNVPFPTLVECWLWRVSSIALIVFPLGIIYVSIVNGYHDDLVMGLWRGQMIKHSLMNWILTWFKEIGAVCKRRGKSKNGSRSIFRMIFHAISIAVTFSMIGYYVAAVAFITLESYISLRSPPDGTFLTPRWVNYWPHV